MEDEFDLRPYIEGIFRRWKLSLVIAFLSALCAFTVSSFLPLSYQAKSLIAYFESDNLFQFDSRISQNDTSTPLKAFPELAKSDEVMALLQESLPQSYTYDREDLTKQLSVTLGDDATIIRFTATADQAQTAAELANLWAETFTNWANNLYSNQGGEQLKYFEEQFSEAETRLNIANQNLVDYAKINQTIVLSNTLHVVQQDHIAKLEHYNNLAQLSTDADALQQLVQAQEQTKPVSLTDQLTYLQLQLTAFGDASSPVFLQTSPGGALSEVSKENQLETLEKFREIINQKLLETKTNLTELEAEILYLQQQLQESLNQESRLIREAQIANETVITLGFKVEEEKVSALDTNDGFKIISYAAAPKNPLGPKRIFNTFIAGSLGFILAIIFIIVHIWWQGFELTSNLVDSS